MKHQNIEPRRSFLVSTAGTTVALVAAVSSGCQDQPTDDRRLHFSSLAQAEEELIRLARAKERISSATWSWAQTLAHCAQSVEYSMIGFPQSKSKAFQRTVGLVAFEVFSWRGYMTHDLAEPIPGAPSLQAEADDNQALDRLRVAIRTFLAWPGELQPHFAYGQLDKREFERAHAMHVANHLSFFGAKE